jgi:hypothetical protein
MIGVTGDVELVLGVFEVVLLGFVVVEVDVV